MARIRPVLNVFTHVPQIIGKHNHPCGDVDSGDEENQKKVGTIWARIAFDFPLLDFPLPARAEETSDPHAG